MTIKFNYEITENNQFQYYNNLSIMNSNLSSINLEISNISPFAFKKYSSYENYNDDKPLLVAASNTSIIDYIIVEKCGKDLIDEEIIDNLEDGISMSVDVAKQMMEIDNSSYAGDGINIGVIETSYPKYITEEVEESIVDSFVYQISNGIKKNAHSTKVISIINCN